MKPLDMKTAFTLDPPNTSSLTPPPPTHAPSKTLHNGCEGYWGNGETKQLENEGLPSPLPLLNLVNVPPSPLAQRWPDTQVVYHLAGGSYWHLILIKYQFIMSLFREEIHAGIVNA